MADEQESTMEDLTELLQSGTLTNPSETALYNADYLRENGDQILTIGGFKKRKFKDKSGKEEVAWVMLFQEDGPGVKLNMTRQDQLFSIMATNRIDEMIGRKIAVIYDPEVKFGSKKVGGVALKRAEDTLV